MDETPNFPILNDQQAVYFNGMGIATTAGDIIITLLRNNVPVLTLNAPYPVARSLSVAIMDAVSNVEQATRQKVPTVEELTKMLSDHRATVLPTA